MGTIFLIIGAAALTLIALMALVQSGKPRTFEHKPLGGSEPSKSGSDTW